MVAYQYIQARWGNNIIMEKTVKIVLKPDYKRVSRYS